MSKFTSAPCAIAQLPVFRKGKPNNAVLGMTSYDSFCDLAGAVSTFYDASAHRPCPSFFDVRCFLVIPFSE
jgi:hypothetical protein